MANGRRWPSKAQAENIYPTFDRRRWPPSKPAIAEFEAANPDIDVVLQNFDHERLQDSIVNFLERGFTGSGHW